MIQYDGHLMEFKPFTDSNICERCGKGMQDHKGAFSTKQYRTTAPFKPRTGEPLIDEINRAVREGILVEVETK